MLASFRSEWLKLWRRPLLIGVLGSMGGFAVLSTVLTILNAGTTPGSGDGPGREFLGTSVDTLTGAGGFMEGVAAASLFIGVIAVVIVAWKVVEEFATGAIRNLLVRQPGRVRLMAGKLAALWSLVALGTVVAAAAGIAAAFATAPIEGISTGAWLSMDGVVAVVEGTGNLLLATVGYAALGAVLGMVFRSAAVAIGVAVAWLLPVENLLAATVDSVSDWLPGQLFGDLASGGAEVGYTTAIVGTLAFAAVGIATATALFARRDVTA